MGNLTDKAGVGTTPLQITKTKAVRRGFHPAKRGTFGATPTLVDFIREGNGNKVLHGCAEVKGNIGRRHVAPTEGVAQ